MKRLALLLIPLSAFAASNQTTPGTLTTLSTFQCISVRAAFSGDANSNNSAAVIWKPHSGSTWQNAYAPIVDHSYTNEARVSIVGLTANTSYDVAVTWSDSDGVVGTASITNTISTLSYTLPTGGSTITCNSDADVTTALSTVNAGQTIHLNPGTYVPFTISRSGNSGAYILVEGDSGGGSIVQGTNINQNILCSANYIIFSHLTLGPSDHSGLKLSDGKTGIWIQDCTFQDTAATCPTNALGDYSDCAIRVGSAWSNIFILRNTISAPSLLNPACTLVPNYQSPGTAISFSPGCTLVISSNTISGGFKDGISQDDSGNWIENVDVNANILSQYKDDGLECKGPDVNVRVWGNFVTNNQGNTFFAGNENITTNPPGPMYVFRNYFYSKSSNTNAGACYKMGTYSAPTFVFHNSVDASECTMDGMVPTAATNAVFTAATFKNNILKTKGSGILYSAQANVFDYNLYDETAGNVIAYRWDINGANATYTTLTQFHTGTGQETHGISADPLFNSDLTIPTNSPAVNVGVVISNFNDASSAWPYRGTAPDMGAFETGQPNPTTPSFWAGSIRAGRVSKP